ncbi:hypothetical protein VIC_002854 [Vibrio coralliilyticus ATCC BAA-450]|nr:hypothetical protein VIC_002854 [Vibrio coralliilyticus ATCC BAA-450]
MLSARADPVSSHSNNGNNALINKFMEEGLEGVSHLQAGGFHRLV